MICSMTVLPSILVVIYLQGEYAAIAQRLASVNQVNITGIQNLGLFWKKMAAGITYKEYQQLRARKASSNENT